MNRIFNKQNRPNTKNYIKVIALSRSVIYLLERAVESESNVFNTLHTKHLTHYGVILVL